MPFYARVNDALSRANSALNQLYSYNDYAHPRSEPNSTIRNNARLTIDPAYYELQDAISEGRWEGVRNIDAYQAREAARYIQAATYSLSDKPDQGRPANVPLAQNQIRQAIDLLERSRW